MAAAHAPWRDIAVLALHAAAVVIVARHLAARARTARDSIHRFAHHRAALGRASTRSPR